MSHHSCTGSCELWIGAFFCVTCGVTHSWICSSSLFQMKTPSLHIPHCSEIAGRSWEMAPFVCTCALWFTQIGQTSSGPASGGCNLFISSVLQHVDWVYCCSEYTHLHSPVCVSCPWNATVCPLLSNCVVKDGGWSERVVMKKICDKGHSDVSGNCGVCRPVRGCETWLYWICCGDVTTGAVTENFESR